MATYAIGDLQGCFRPLMQLLEEVEFDPERDQIWIVGDLVNRGPASLEVLRWCYANRDHLVTVLGNHDLYLLALAAGAVQRKKRDTLDDILEAEDSNELLEWLRARPLIHRDGDWLMVHAGLHPSWRLEEAERYARDVERRIQIGSQASFESLFELPPSKVAADAPVAELHRYALAVMTRMRMCSDDGALDFDYKGSPHDAPSDLRPWFTLRDPNSSPVTVIFGHWAALGLHMANGVIGLDSGCVWGRALTAVRLDDRAVFKVPCSFDEVMEN